MKGLLMGPVTFDAHSRDYLLVTKDRVSCGIMKPWDPNDPRGYNGRENVYTKGRVRRLLSRWSPKFGERLLGPFNCGRRLMATAS